MNIIRTINTIKKILTEVERKRVKVSLLLITLFTFVEVGGLSIVPLYINWLVTGEKSAFFDSEFLSYFDKYELGVLIGVVVSLGTLFSYLIIKNILITSQLIGARLSSDLFEQYINSDDDTDQSALLNLVTMECDRFASFILTPIFFIFSRAILALFLIAVLITYNSEYSLPLILVLAIVFYAIFYKARGVARIFGTAISKANSGRIHEIKSIYNLKHEILLYKKGQSAVRRYIELSKKYAQSRAVVEIMSKQPRYIFEVVVLVGGLMLAVILHDDPSLNPLEFLLMFGVVGYKLMPAIHQVQSFYAVFRGNVNALYELDKSIKTDCVKKKDFDDVKYIETIKISGITICHDNNLLTYNDIIFKKGLMYGLVGPSGCGKSTLIGLLAGFGENIKKFEVYVNERMYSWDTFRELMRDHTAYLPQNTVVYGTTISESISLEKDAVGLDKYFYKSPWSFSERNFNGKFLDEQLSGGESQRLNIARALYYERDVYIFDESLSGVDATTRLMVINDLKNLARGGKIVIVISHDPNDMNYVDVVVNI